MVFFVAPKVILLSVFTVPNPLPLTVTPTPGIAAPSPSRNTTFSPPNVTSVSAVTPTLHKPGRFIVFTVNKPSPPGKPPNSLIVVSNLLLLVVTLITAFLPTAMSGTATIIQNCRHDCPLPQFTMVAGVHSLFS